MEQKEKYAEIVINRIAKQLSIDISGYDMAEMVKGMIVELEHGSKDDETNVTNDDAVETFKIMLAHVKEVPDYYTRLEKFVENEAGKVNTDDGETENEEETDEPVEEKESEEKEEKTINEARRFKELCGIVENEQKIQLKNEIFFNKESKKETKLLSEELNMEDFDVIKFKANDLGGKETEEEKALYKMQKKNKDDVIDLEEF